MIRLIHTILLFFLITSISAQEFNEQKIRRTLDKLSQKEQLKFIDSINNTYNIENNDIGIKQVDFFIRYVKKNNFPKKILGGLLYSRGSLYRKQGRYSDALEDLKLSEKIYTEIKDLNAISSVYSAYSNIYFSVGDNVKAIKFINQAIRQNELTKNLDGLGVSYNTLGNIYLSLKNYDSTLFYYKKSFTIYKKTNSSYQMSLILDNISMVYVENKIVDSAQIYSKLAREEAKKIKDSYLELQLLLNATAVEDLAKRRDGQIELAKRAKFLADSLRVPIYQIFTNANYADAMHRNGKLKEAISIYNSFISDAESMQLNEMLVEVYANLSEIYGELNQIEEAFNYYKLSIAKKDTLEKQHAADKVNELIARNQLENKENKIQHERELRKAEKSAFETEKESLEQTQVLQKWVIIISILAIIITIVLIIIINNRLSENRKLNTLMKEKNAEILVKNKSLHESKQEIISSINYAKRIQFALLAHDELLHKNLPEHFVLFKPKDIVSGDFYWGTGGVNSNSDFYLAVCDSTGHGVPGAFMSLLNISFLNEAINEKNITAPHEILNHVKKRLIQNMEGAKDGMDAILVKFNLAPTSLKVDYAAAHNHPVLIRDGKLTELPADKLPVGLDDRNISFSNHSIKLQKGDLLFLYTDGYPDQFGGPKNKKFKNGNLHQLFLKNAHRTLDEIRQELLNELEKWQGNNEQVDDICIIGIRI